MGFVLDAPVLDGRLVRLEPLSRGHVAELAVAAEEGRESYGHTWVPRASEVAEYVEAQLERRDSGRLAPYAQVSRLTGRAVGGDRVLGPSPASRQRRTVRHRGRLHLARGLGAGHRHQRRSEAAPVHARLRGVAMYSIIAPEWRETKSRLQDKVNHSA